MIRDYPDRRMFIDRDAPIHAEAITAVEVAATFISIWTKGMVKPWEDSEHNPHEFHKGDEKLSWVDEVFLERKYRVMGWKQHFHRRIDNPALADLEPWRPWMHETLWQEMAANMP